MKPMILLSGPCVLEDLDLGLRVASRLQEVTSRLGGIQYYFKASFDKANRSHRDSYRGPGLETGLRWFEEIKRQVGCQLVTDFHEPSQANVLAPVIDVLQIPAFLCRQTDMLLAADEAAQKFNRVVNVKKGQFLAPWDVGNILSKFSVPKDQVWLTERGTTFGYGNLVVDMTSFMRMKEAGASVTIFDGTHSVQRPSQGAVTLGDRRFALVLARSALVAGANGLFLECHPTPDLAKSDAANCLQIEDLVKALPELVRLSQMP